MTAAAERHATALSDPGALQQPHPFERARLRRQCSLCRGLLRRGKRVRRRNAAAPRVPHRLRAALLRLWSEPPRKARVRGDRLRRELRPLTRAPRGGTAMGGCLRGQHRRAPPRRLRHWCACRRPPRHDHSRVLRREMRISRGSGCGLSGAGASVLRRAGRRGPSRTRRAVCSSRPCRPAHCVRLGRARVQLLRLGSGASPVVAVGVIQPAAIQNQLVPSAHDEARRLRWNVWRLPHWRRWRGPRAHCSSVGQDVASHIDHVAPRGGGRRGGESYVRRWLCRPRAGARVTCGQRARWLAHCRVSLVIGRPWRPARPGGLHRSHAPTSPLRQS